MKRPTTLTSAIALCLVTACGSHESGGSTGAAPWDCSVPGSNCGSWAAPSPPSVSGYTGFAGGPPAGNGSAFVSCDHGGIEVGGSAGSGVGVGGDPGGYGAEGGYGRAGGSFEVAGGPGVGQVGGGGGGGGAGDPGAAGGTGGGGASGAAGGTGGGGASGGAAGSGEAGRTGVDPAGCRHSVDVCLAQYDDCVAYGDSGCLHIIDVCAALARDCE